MTEERRAGAGELIAGLGGVQHRGGRGRADGASVGNRRSDSGGEAGDDMQGPGWSPRATWIGGGITPHVHARLLLLLLLLSHSGSSCLVKVH